MRTVSQPDLNGGFQVIRRDLEESRPTASGATESRTTVLRPGLQRGLVPAEQIVKVEQKQSNLEKIHTSRLLPDSNGGWRINNEEDRVIATKSNSSRTE